MFPVIEAKFSAKKEPYFGVTAAIKHQQRLCWILGRVDLVAAGGMRIWPCDADDGGGWGRWMRTS